VKKYGGESPEATWRQGSKEMGKDWIFRSGLKNSCQTRLDPSTEGKKIVP